MSNTRTTPLHPYRLSESTLKLLHSCERKFQLNRLLAPDEPLATYGPSVPQVRGHAHGVGVQTYILTGDMDKAVYAAWLAYDPEIYDEKKKIYLWRCINNLLVCKDMMDRIRQRYRVATFQGRPAVELSYRLDIDDKWYFVGYIDLVLQDTVSSMYSVLEVKSTTYNLQDLRPIYRNSGQALGYSIAIDQIVGEKQSKYGVNYFVCRDGTAGDNYVPDVYFFPFTKTLLDRLRWFYTMGLDVQRLNTMLENDLFPMRGDSCVAFNTVCPHYGTCTLTSTDRPREVFEDTTPYQFRYKLDAVIEDHIQRIDQERVQGIVERAPVEEV